MSLGYLAGLSFGHIGAQVVHSAVRLGVVDALACGPRSVAEAAAVVECDVTGLGRLVRAMVVLGLVDEVGVDEVGVEEVGVARYVLAGRAQALRADHPQSMRATILMQGHPAVWQAWGGLGDAVRTGGTAFDQVHHSGLFDYMTGDPDLSETFDTAMDRGTRVLAREVVKAHDFGGSRVVVDVGGGRGALLARILLGTPGASGVLFDRPEVVVDAAATFRTAGLADRATVEPGDFFAAVPQGDVLLVQGILHDWDDERCLTLLRNCRRSITDDGRLLVLEPVLPARLTEPEAREAVISDLAMLVYTGGYERSRDAYAALLGAAGFALAEVGPPLPGSATRILVAQPSG